jgi:transposase
MLDELVAAESLVRVIDAWVNSLNLQELGFGKAVAQGRGAPPYHPGDLLKLYVWGFINAVRSSRRLEAACHRDVQCMWLLGRMAPDHKTISDFRRQNAEALLKACAGFVQFARQMGLVRGTTVAVDGSKLRAASSICRLAGKDRLQEMARRNLEEVQAYIDLLDGNDEQEQRQQQCTPEAARRALSKLQAEGARIQECLQQVVQESRRAAVTTEPEARPMKSLHGAPGYNLQAAVDTETHLVLHHDVCGDANDRNQLAPMAVATSEVLQQPCTVLADTGYANGEHLHRLEQQDIVAVVPAAPKTNIHGLLEHSAFDYDRQNDCFVCPQGKLLPFRRINKGSGMRVYMASAKDCSTCPMKSDCASGKQRYITRNPHEDAIQAAAGRWTEDPQLRKQRSSTVEHVFGTLKHQILGNARLLLGGMTGARAECALAVLAYNIKRVFNMKGGSWMHEALQG